MEKPRIRHIAVNVQDSEKTAEYYKKIFGLEEQLRAANGTIYLSEGFVDLALISTTRLPRGINHFGFQVESVEAIVKIANHRRGQCLRRDRRKLDPRP
jgi:catechol 2,3-dioxygenase-like lactoylglutathione lyase family enzyme